MGTFDVTHEDIRILIQELGGSVVSVIGDGPFDVLVHGSKLTAFGQNTIHKYKSASIPRYQGVTVLNELDLENLLRQASGKTQTKIEPAAISKGYGEW